MENLRHQNQAICRKKFFDNDLVAIRKSTVTLTLKKAAYVRMCILDLSKVLLHKFHYDYIKINIVTTQGYYSLTLIACCMKLKPKMFVKI